MRSTIKVLIRRIITYKFFKINKYIKGKKICILDIGAGNHSATKTKEYFVNCIYHAVDITQNYANDQQDFLQMDQFFELDLTKLNFDSIPNENYDLIIMSHVIEHLYNGDLVINALLPKLKNKGIIYIEWPSVRSTKFPSKKGTLNFFDDKTHIRIYTILEIYNILLNKKLKFCEGGVRRSLRLIVIIPLKIIWDKVTRGYVLASTFWDLLGFSEYCIFQKE